MKLDYRITVIFNDEVIRVKFATEEVAKSAIQELKKLFPDKYMSGALEERKEFWKVIWVLGVDKLSRL